MASNPPARPWPRVKWTRAGQVAALTAGGGAAIPADLSPADAFAATRDVDPAAALRFVAQVLPRVEAVRWMVACLDLDGRPTAPGPATARKAARRWADAPSDEARLLAWDAASALGFEGPDGAACLAVFLSGGTMSPAPVAPGTPPVNPPPGLFGQAVAGAVLLAAYDAGAPAFSGRAARMLDLAEGYATGEGGR